MFTRAIITIQRTAIYRRFITAFSCCLRNRFINPNTIFTGITSLWFRFRTRTILWFTDIFVSTQRTIVCHSAAITTSRFINHLHSVNALSINTLYTTTCANSAPNMVVANMTGIWSIIIAYAIHTAAQWSAVNVCIAKTVAINTPTILTAISIWTIFIHIASNNWTYSSTKTIIKVKHHTICFLITIFFLSRCFIHWVVMIIISNLN